MSSKIKYDEKSFLRKKAEERLLKKYSYLRRPDGSNPVKAIEELWIHQIELEMENEEIRKSQQELIESSKRFEKLFNLLPIGYFVLDENRYIKDVNLTGANMLGLEKSAIINEPFNAYIQKESYDTYYLCIRKALLDKTQKRCEIKLINKKNGKEFDAELIIDPLCEQGDTLNFFRVAALDISQRKIKEQELSDGRVELEKRVKEKTSDLLQVVNLLRNEIEQRKQADIELQKRSKELEQSEKKYRTLVEVSPNAVCVAVEDKIVFVNNTTVKILNAKNSEELKGKSVWQFIHPDSVDTIKSRLNQFKDSKKEAEVAEVKLIRCDGTFIDVGGTSALIDYEGKPGRLIIFQDISVRKKQEASLKKIKSRLVEAQRIAHLGNWDWDIVNNSFWLSDECYRILGIDPQYFDGNFEALNKLIHPDDRQGVKETNDQAIKNCKSFNLEFRVIRPDGVIRSIHKRGEVQCVNNQAVRLLGTIQDITEQKKAESQLILSRQKLRTLAAKMEMIEEQERRRIASDLHDSIGQILAFATRELKYMRKNLPKKYSDALLEIAEELDKAVVQARTLSFDLSPSILYDIGFEIAVEDLLEKFSSERKINYQFENDEHPKPLTIPLKILLYRSIRELLMNIAKHANAKDVKVSLIKEGINIKVIVEDNGKGFDVAEIDEGEKTKGFGLFNIRERIEHLGGKFKIESIKGKGTKTTIIAPLTIDTVNNFEKEEEVQGYHK